MSKTDSRFTVAWYCAHVQEGQRWIDPVQHDAMEGFFRFKQDVIEPNLDTSEQVGFMVLKCPIPQPVLKRVKRELETYVHPSMYYVAGTDFVVNQDHFAEEGVFLSAQSQHDAAWAQQSAAKRPKKQ